MRTLAALLLLSPVIARAQQPILPTSTGAAPTPAIVRVDSVAAAPALAPFERPNGALLRAGALRYTITLRANDGTVTPLGSRDVNVTDSPLGGAPSWLIAESRSGTAVATSDSLFLARADLAPERWAAVNGTSSIAISFTRDTAYGATQSYRGRASFTLASPPNVLLSAGMAERVIEMLPLREGYHVAATLMVVESGIARLVPAEINVERSEQVQAGAARVDAWVVTLRAGAAEERLWVSRDGSRAVRTEQATPSGLLIQELAP